MHLNPSGGPLRIETDLDPSAKAARRPHFTSESRVTIRRPISLPPVGAAIRVDAYLLAPFCRLSGSRTTAIFGEINVVDRGPL